MKSITLILITLLTASINSFASNGKCSPENYNYATNLFNQALEEKGQCQQVKNYAINSLYSWNLNDAKYNHDQKSVHCNNAMNALLKALNVYHYMYNDCGPEDQRQLQRNRTEIFNLAKQIVEM